MLTVVRIILIPVFAVLFYNDQLIWAVFVLFLSGLTDFLDGKIARRFNQISELGKILDPIADKLTQITIAVMLFFEFRGADGGANPWLLLGSLVRAGLEGLREELAPAEVIVELHECAHTLNELHSHTL